MTEEAQVSCVFCRIIRGELTRDVIAFRDSQTVVFPSRRQQPGNHGHMLVVPILHVPYIYDVEGELAGALMATLARVAAAVKGVFGADGVSIRQNNEHHGGQDVFHVHFHVIPRFADDQFNQGHNRYPDGAVEIPLEERIEQAMKLSEVLKLGVR